jgi:A/G-specific adenine glycosylase
LRWYEAHRRDLPWRRTRDPYKIWVSEIMLQQTRVAAVLAHYRAFLRRFPTLRELAAAREDEVLAVWSGLGYYRRARMLHSAAKEVAQRYQGRLPRTLEELRGLPGIGRYTAAAIASIAYGVPTAVVDGNVERVIARLDGSARKDVWARADELLDPLRPGDFNQAMMELGATVCLPEKPRCDRCPVREACATRGVLPTSRSEVRLKKTLAYALARRNGSVRLVQRGKRESLMAGMWELPALAQTSKTGSSGAPVMRLRHSITTTDYTVSVYEASSEAGKWMPLARLADVPLTGLTRKVLRRAGVL